MDRGSIKLSFYQPEYKTELLNFDLPAEQLKFTGLPINAIEVSYKENKRHPVVILAEDLPVGFFVLHYGEGIRSFTNNSNVILLRTFSINHIHQGKGYAKAALVLLPSFVKEHFPEMEEIVLVVNHSNPVARNLYVKAGFEDKGER